MHGNTEMLTQGLFQELVIQLRGVLSATGALTEAINDPVNHFSNLDLSSTILGKEG